MKKWMKVWTLCLAAVVCLGACFGCGGKGITLQQLKDKGTLVMATNAEFPPFEYVEGDQFKGVDVELGTAIAELLGVELKIDDMKFESVVTSVGSGKADIAMAGLTVDADRAKVVDFSESYYEASQYLIVAKNDTTFDGCTTKAEVDAKINELGANAKIGFQVGTTGQYYSEGRTDSEGNVVYPGFAQAVKKGYENGTYAVTDLMNNSINIVMIDAAPAESHVKKHPNDLKLIEVKLTEEKYAIGVRKNSPEVLKAINDALATLKENGTFDKIMQKYFGAETVSE